MISGSYAATVGATASSMLGSLSAWRTRIERILEGIEGRRVLRTNLVPTDPKNSAAGLGRESVSPAGTKRIAPTTTMERQAADQPDRGGYHRQRCGFRDAADVHGKRVAVSAP